jgi:hypothetical protein
MRLPAAVALLATRDAFASNVQTPLLTEPGGKGMIVGERGGGVSSGNTGRPVSSLQQQCSDCYEAKAAKRLVMMNVM